MRNALVKLHEKLGFKLQKTDLRLIGQHRYTDHLTSVWGNVYYAKLGQSANGQEVSLENHEEYCGVEYMTAKEIEEFIEKQDKYGYSGPRITPVTVSMF